MENIGLLLEIQVNHRRHFLDSPEKKRTICN